MTEPLRDTGDRRARLIERVAIVVLIVLFAAFAIPSALIVFADDADKRLAAVMVLAFWGWFTSRGVVQFRDPNASRDARFWFTSAAGYAVLALILLAFQMWDDARGNLDVRSVTLTLLVIVLLMLTGLAGRHVAMRDRGGDEVD